jgi:hypothetical protein
MTMKLAKVVVGSAMLALAPLAASAADMSYSFVDVGYIETDIDGVSDKADGFALRGSVGFAQNWFVLAEYVAQSVSEFDVDIDTISVGFGGHYGINENLDVVGKLAYTEVDLSAPGGLDASDDGFFLEAGLRGRVADAVELEGGLRYVDFSDGGDDTGFYVAGRYHFNAMWAVGAEYRSADDASSWLAGVRVSF